MIHLPEMHQFVEDDVVGYKLRSLKQTPVQGNGSTTGTGAPTRFLIPDAHARHFQSVLVGEAKNFRRQFRGGETMQVTFNLWSMILINVGDADGVVREGDGASSVHAVGKHNNLDGLSSEQNVRADAPHSFSSRSGHQPLH